MSRARLGLITVVGLFLIIQLIPVNQVNPPIIKRAIVPADVEVLLRESCYDCHSYETEWPWYSRIAPGSFLITHDVIEGRRHLNFSDFSGMDSFDSMDVAEEILEVLEKGEMPPSQYLILHPGASLSNSELNTLRSWANSLYGE